jgi:hypothetical protein
MVIVLPKIVPTAPLATPGPAKPYFLSAGTRSISGTYGKVSFGPLDLSASSPNCVAATGGGRNCTIQVQVPAGTQDLRMTTAGAKTKFGPLALMGKTKVKIRPGVMNYVPALKWFGFAHKVRITATPKNLTQFTPSQTTLMVYGVDGSGNVIPETGLIDLSTVGFITVTTATGAYTQSLDVPNFTPTTWAYDGRRDGTETFNTKASVGKTVVATASVSIQIAPGNASSIGQVIAASGQSPGISVVEFSAYAVGNVAPLRTLPSSGSPYGVQSDGSFWMGQQRFDTLGDVLGQVKNPHPADFATAQTVDSAQNEYGAYIPTGDSSCSGNAHILVFAANSYGATQTRNITMPAGCSPTELAVDGPGVLYAYVAPSYYGSATGTVLEFPANTSGVVPPSHTIGNIFLSNLVGDSAGNLYALYSASAGTPPTTLVKFAPNATTWTTVLPGVTVSAFALDSEGDIYAEVPTSSSAFQIEEFLAGSTSATRVIGGSSTNLTVPAGIAVQP